MADLTVDIGRTGPVLALNAIEQQQPSEKHTAKAPC